jgi:hypothetical protein
VLFARRDRQRPQRPEDEMITFDLLEDLLKLRTGRHAIDAGASESCCRVAMSKKWFNTYARALRDHAADVLQGDFTSFPELEKIVRKRMQDHTSV